MNLQLKSGPVDEPAFPLVMGVLNVTPDSFSDGGDYADPIQAVECALEMIAAGADIIDVGPESTRPGSNSIPADEQIARAVPVIESIRETNPQVSLSIDTSLSYVARAALDAGADLVNDTSALRDDPEMRDVLRETGALVCLMHRQGTPADMQRGGGPHYDDVVEEIREFLIERIQYATAGGIDESRIILDPGIGFGKRLEHNLLILKHLDRFVDLGYPVLVGASRKSFIGSVLGIDEPKQRLAGSLACATVAALSGAAIIRAHDVKPTVEAIRLGAAVREARGGE